MSDGFSSSNAVERLDVATKCNYWAGQHVKTHLIQRVERQRGKFVAPFLPTTIVGIGGKSKETRQFRFGSLAGTNQAKRGMPVRTPS